ncbi:Gfo/Idh/MocA family oxidoreductase [Cyclobacterium sp.]|uniref:Gfo/Idh/MocA family protein n=1 Tax=Cyclobacterium sp. TaxID=1966343 RepID=UPI00198CCCBE|nr:Gfo/Idh/MocA family oxidoreductase [Cyclobacterium sp.]MBD3629341.1 Gfo/Idh/MocA family oxidoreductase [Cyclobacterium sp.]
MKNSRRTFVKKAIAGATLASVGGMLPGMSAKSYGRIMGANERINAASMGVVSRGHAVGTNFASQEQCDVIYSCDVDIRAAEKFAGSVNDIQGSRPKIEKDIRKVLEDKDVDVLIVTAPDHWHAPAALMALKAGKHVYLEKPCSHNPREGELLMEAQKKYNKVIQVGNQRRSWPNVMKGIEELHNGVIGRPYMAKTWYANNRGPIGVGKQVPVPEWLDYELWQGPAPREAYRDNILHYNWHWFWNWGTGEALNNGTHMVDLARWGLQVDYPSRVNSSGGRYRYNDDWETPDTQIINLEFDNNSVITWEGRSCNGKHIENGSVGTLFYGEEGSLLIEGGNSYKIFNLKNELVKDVKNDQEIDPTNRTNPAQALDAMHIQNFFDGIINGTEVRSEIVGAHKSTLLVQLGNIAQRVGRTLDIDPKTGNIQYDPTAMELWKREYEPGWEPTV